MANKNENRDNKGRRPNPDDKFEWKKAARTVSFWILIFLASIVIAQAFNFGEQREARLPYTEYRQLLDEGRIFSGYIIENEFHGEYQTDPRNPESDKIRFQTILPFIENWMLEEWDEKGVD